MVGALRTGMNVLAEPRPALRRARLPTRRERSIVGARGRAQMRQRGPAAQTAYNWRVKLTWHGMSVGAAGRPARRGVVHSAWPALKTWSGVEFGRGGTSVKGRA
eukprot:3840270-Pyramimonas_sp.AAC.2